MKILLLCNGGVSTSILAASIKKYLTSDDLIVAMPITQGQSEIKNFDVILIAPQIKSVYSKLKQLNSDAKIIVIDEKHYGCLDGHAVFEQIQKIAPHNLKKGNDKMKKLKITLCCNGGVSTKALCKKIIAAAESHGFEIECDAYSTTMIDEAAPGSDIILMGPQIKFMYKTIQSRFPDIPVEVIGMREYGSMNGQKVFEEMLEKYKW